MSALRFIGPHSECAIILAPAGRDAEIARRIFSEAGRDALIVADLPGLVAAIEAGAGFALITEEALRTADVAPLAAALTAQPPWSDFPIILLTERGGVERNPQASRMQAQLGNVLFLERPFHPTTLVSLSHAALRARQRQYEARERLETIRLGERQLQIALAAADLGAWYLDVASMSLDASPRCKAHYGYGEDSEFTYQALIASIHPGDLARVRTVVTAAIVGRGDYDVEYRCRWPDDTVHWVMVRGQLDPSTDPAAPRLSGVSFDITARKQAEAALLESERRFRAAIDAVSGVLWTNDSQGRMVGEQSGWGALTGQSYEAYQGFGWADAVHPDDTKPTIESWQLAVAERRMFRFEHRVRRHDGAWRNFAIRAVPAFDGDGSIREWVGVHTDITEQRRAEAALKSLTTNLERRVAAATRELRASEARMRSMFEASFQFFAQLDPRGRLLDANATSLAAIGTGLASVIGANFWETPWFAGTPDMPEMIRAAIVDVAAGGSFREEISLDLPGGPLCLDFALRAVRGPNGESISLVAEALDVTQRKQATERLVQAQKLETIGQLTGGVAHDFNNLLTPIVASLDMIHRRLEGDARAQKWAAAAMQSADRAKVLVSRLLAFARRQPLDTAPVDVGMLVGGLGDLILRSLGPTIVFRTVMPDHPAIATVDANQLELALLNLCVNSRDAMPGGGELAVTIGCAPASAAPVALPPGEYVTLAVRDTGTGMSAQTIARAIEPFYTTKEVGKGTGLGLSMVHGLAAQLGGAMHIASTPGAGTTITLWLPAAGAAAAGGSAEEPAARLPSRSARILLVDDEELVRSVSADILRDAGYDVTEAASPAAAREILRSGYTPEVLVTDQLMPGGKGSDLAVEFTALVPHLAVLIVTGFTDMPSAPWPRLAKPFSGAALVERVRGLVEPA